MKIGISILILIVIPTLTNSKYINSYECNNPNNRLGLCISLYSCPTILRLFLNSTTKPENGTFLEKSYCENGFGAWPFVCCSNDTSYTNDIPEGDLPATQQECTRDSYLSIAVFPSLNVFCLGSLISDRYILTSAFCAANAGSHVLSIGKTYSTDFSIQQKIPHQKYVAGLYESVDNIGLLRLDKRVQYSNEIAPSCLPSAVSGFKPYELGNEIITTKHFGNYGWYIVNLIHLGKIVAECNNNTSHKHLALSDIRNDIYYFLYGAPAVSKQYGAWVTEAVYGFDVTNDCNVFTRVSHYENWILSEIKP